jgi:hypothetical protein
MYIKYQLHLNWLSWYYMYCIHLAVCTGYSQRRCLSNCGSRNSDITLTVWRKIYADYDLCCAKHKATFRTPGIIKNGTREQGRPTGSLPHGITNDLIHTLTPMANTDVAAQLPWSHAEAGETVKHAMSSVHPGVGEWLSESHPCCPGIQCGVMPRYLLLRLLVFYVMFVLRSKRQLSIENITQHNAKGIGRTSTQEINVSFGVTQINAAAV